MSVDHYKFPRLDDSGCQKKGRRRVYNETYKRGAIDAFQSALPFFPSRRALAEAMRKEYGIPSQTLLRWADIEEGGRNVVGSDDLMAEIKKLTRRVAQIEKLARKQS